MKKKYSLDFFIANCIETDSGLPFPKFFQKNREGEAKGIHFGKQVMNRCPWVGQNKPHYEHYHDTEWGIPVHDDQKHFEMLILEGAQAGLSWETIMYAYMQAVGMVDDHIKGCFRCSEQ